MCWLSCLRSELQAAGYDPASRRQDGGNEKSKYPSERMQAEEHPHMTNLLASHIQGCAL